MPAELDIDWSEIAPRPHGVPEELAARLERRLRDGSVTPGMKLPPERELAGQLGVSRASLRQAMHELTLKGLLARKPGTGTIVLGTAQRANDLLAKMSSADRDLREVADFRHVFEPRIAELAAERAVPSDLRELEDLCDVDAKALSPTASVELDERFHIGLASATHNALLVSLVTTTCDWLHQVRLDAQRPTEAREISWSEHRRILVAVAQHDSPAAGQAMADHIRTFASRAIGSRGR